MLFLLHGLDTYRSRAKLDRLLQKFIAANPDGTVSRADGEELSPSLLSELISPTLFAGKRLIIIENLISKASLEDSQRFAEIISAQDNETFIIFWENTSVDLASPLGIRLNQPGQVESFDNLKAGELTKWTVQTATDRGLDLSSSTAGLLAEACGGDTWQISSEIAKLAALKRPITPDLIAEIVTRPLAAKAFDLLDAIAAGNTPATNRLVGNLLQNGEDPIRLLSLLAYNFRALVRVADLAAQGKTRPEIIKLTKLHPFAAGKAIQQAERQPRTWFVSAYQTLADSDWLIKTGQREAEAELNKLTVQLAQRT